MALRPSQRPLTAAYRTIAASLESHSRGESRSWTGGARSLRPIRKRSCVGGSPKKVPPAAERATVWGGRLSIDTASPGTRVQVALPL